MLNLAKNSFLVVKNMTKSCEAAVLSKQFPMSYMRIRSIRLALEIADGCRQMVELYNT